MAQIENPQTFRAFWRDEIAARNNTLQAFTELANDEALRDVRLGIDSPFMVLLDPEFRTIDQRSNNVQQSIDFGFFILKPATDKQKLSEIKTLQNDCYTIYKEIVGRLEYLNEEKEFFGKYHATNTTCETIGGLFGGNHFGVQVFGQFITKEGIKHDGTKWT